VQRAGGSTRSASRAAPLLVGRGALRLGLLLLLPLPPHPAAAAGGAGGGRCGGPRASARTAAPPCGGGTRRAPGLRCSLPGLQAPQSPPSTACLSLQTPAAASLPLWHSLSLAERGGWARWCRIVSELEIFTRACQEHAPTHADQSKRHTSMLALARPRAPRAPPGLCAVSSEGLAPPKHWWPTTGAGACPPSNRRLLTPVS